VPLWREPGSGADWTQAQAASRRFNAMAAERLAPFGVGSGQLGLSAPALGGALTASHLELAVVQRLIQAADDGAPVAGAGSDGVHEVVRRLLPPGPPPEQAVLDEIGQLVTELLQERLPVWRSFGIV
jgi:hypothetical protein